MYQKKKYFLVVYAFLNILFSNTLYSKSLDEILPPDQRICGVPSLEVFHENENDHQFILYDFIENRELLVKTDERTFVYLSKILNTDYSYRLRVCVPIDPLDIRPGASNYITWFAWWDIGGSGVSVSNQ